MHPVKMKSTVQYVYQQTINRLPAMLFQIFLNKVPIDFPFPYSPLLLINTNYIYLPTAVWSCP